tara:strand:- start:1556 stop:1912 length:357 start_codon:yes stop_codon:yes gene_type:complete
MSNGMLAMTREEREALRENRSVGQTAKTPEIVSQASLVHACKECGAKFSKDGRDKHFCRSKCRNAFNNRKKARGAILVDLFMRARFDRKGTGKGAYSEMCTLASVWREEDKKAGRASF